MKVMPEMMILKLITEIFIPMIYPLCSKQTNMTYQFFSELPATEKKDYKLAYDFRVKNTEGIYRRYMHQTIILEQDKNGKTWLSLVITNLLSEKATGEKPQRRMINMKTGKLHLFNNDDESNSGLLLTKRETEILSLITHGYDTKNISDKLFISVNTVNNHRQNILRKNKNRKHNPGFALCKKTWTNITRNNQSLQERNLNIQELYFCLNDLP